MAKDQDLERSRGLLNRIAKAGPVAAVAVVLVVVLVVVWFVT